jgi:hypothetical protein
MTVIAMSLTAGLAAGAHAQDRYGSASAYDSSPPTPMATLTWPGKTAAPPAAPRYVAYGRPALQSPPQAAPQTAPTSLYDPPPPRWRAVEDSASQAPAPPSAAAPAPAPDPTPASAANGQTVRDGQPPHFYSLARQYGVQPDPIALSPQFLASTPQADMAEPPPLPPSHTLGAQSANMSTAAATSQLRQAQEAASDAETASLGN